MFHVTFFNNRIVLVSVETWLGYTVREYQLRYAGKTVYMHVGVPGRGTSAMWSMVVDATSCEVLGVIA